MKKISSFINYIINSKKILQESPHYNLKSGRTIDLELEVCYGNKNNDFLDYIENFLIIRNHTILHTVNDHKSISIDSNLIKTFCERLIKDSVFINFINQIRGNLWYIYSEVDDIGEDLLLHSFKAVQSIKVLLHRIINLDTKLDDNQLNTISDEKFNEYRDVLINSVELQDLYKTHENKLLTYINDWLSGKEMLIKGKDKITVHPDEVSDLAYNIIYNTKCFSVPRDEITKRYGKETWDKVEKLAMRYL